MTRLWSDDAALDAAAHADDARWRERMAASRLPAPPAPRVCRACGGRALGDDAGPCRPCGGVGWVMG